MHSPELLIGADPELFLLTKAGERVSAHTYLPGSKQFPYPVPFGAVQVDGTAAEFNIDPAATEDQFVMHISQVMGMLEEMLDPSVELDISPVAEYPTEYMDKLPGYVKKLGCEPDFNAYTMGENPKPDETVPYRTASGHMHIGWGKDFNVHDSAHRETCFLMGKQLDFWVGLVCTILDKDEKRKCLYGKAGALRIKPYGMEYRVPSNWWLKEEGYMRLVYSNATAAFNMLKEGRVLSEEYGDVCRDIIDTNNADAAVELCNKIGIPFWSLV